MTKLKLPFLIAVIVAFIIALVLQQRALRRLRDENSSLRQLLEQASQLAPENERLSNSLAQSKAAFSEDQKRELLRSRAEIASLRRHTNDLAKLQEENRRLRTARTADARTSDDREQELEQWKQVAIVKMNDAKKTVLGMLLHAEEQPGAVVTNLDQVAKYMRNQDGTLAVTNEFEFVYGGNFRALTNPSSTIVIREREAWQHPNGKWFKAYGFADGHSEIHTEQDGNFEAWEKPRLPLPPTNP